ncbi:AMP-binding protein [Neisseria sp. Ec49-e6-T10]|uniref:AMP-binding protein n=1 Tax=Neisseria sp. Ec49-e6-T10 TaxID=3140744 RepID=UPI003EBC360E
MSQLLATVTQNERLPLVLGDFSSLSRALDYAAQGKTGVNFYQSTGVLTHTLTYQQLREQALKMAQLLKNYGFKEGSKLGIIGQTGPEFLIIFFACQYIGAIPCPFPFTIYLGGKEAYEEKLKSLALIAMPEAIISPITIKACIEQAVYGTQIKILIFEDLIQQLTHVVGVKNYIDYSTAYIQFSSGSTAQPKGIEVSQQALMANIQAILKEGMKLQPTDRAFSWLPFYHDMGLVGFILASVAAQRSVDYLAPTSFARRPSLWLELMSKQLSTITYAPGFAYELVTKRFKQDQIVDLSNLRIAGIGAEKIKPSILRSFAQKFESMGFNQQAFLPSYGMAEAVLAITMRDQSQPLLIDKIDTGEVVSCGRVLPDYDYLILDEQQQLVLEKQIGSIWIKGPSIINEYVDHSCAEVLDNGFMKTGDLGYRYQNQLFITGREKDLMIIHGRNIWAQDIEWLLSQSIQELRQQDIAVFSVEQPNNEDDKVVILVQSRTSDQTKLNQFSEDIQTIVMQAFAIKSVVQFIPAHSLPFTSSGKLSRTEAKKRYLSDTFSSTLNKDI